MQIRYSKKKEEMREDPFIEFLFSAKSFIVRRTNLILAVAVGLVVVGGGWWLYAGIRQRRIALAQEAFGMAMLAYDGKDRQKAIEALAAVCETHSGTPHAAYSSFLLGSMLAGDGRYDEAQRWFEMAYEKGPKNGLVVALAAEAIAVCYEHANKPQEAMKFFEKALTYPSIAYRRSAIRWKMALIAYEQGDIRRSEDLCREIIADTAAVRWRSLAENLLIELQMRSRG